MKIAKQVRQKLNDGELIFGAFVPYREPALIEMLARSGFDCLILDAEHGLLSEADMPALALACEASDCLPIVRIASTAPRDVGRFLDFGAQAILAPMINTASQAKHLLDVMHYPPVGVRGYAPTRSTDANLSLERVSDHIQSTNDALLSIVQIETKEAVENLSDILALDGVDVVFIGPADLSVSLGVPMQFDHPDFLKAVMTIAQATTQSGKHLGAAISTPKEAAMMHQFGVRFIAGYFDTISAAMWRSFMEEARSLVSQT